MTPLRGFRSESTGIAERTGGLSPYPRLTQYETGVKPANAGVKSVHDGVISGDIGVRSTMVEANAGGTGVIAAGAREKQADGSVESVDVSVPVGVKAVNASVYSTMVDAIRCNISVHSTMVETSARRRHARRSE